jgi:hypothetical protein
MADGKVWRVAEETLYGARLAASGAERPMRAVARVTRASGLVGFSQRWVVGLDVRTSPHDRSGEEDGREAVLLVPFSLGYKVPTLVALADCRRFVLDYLRHQYEMREVDKEVWDDLHDKWETERRLAPTRAERERVANDADLR